MGEMLETDSTHLKRAGMFLQLAVLQGKSVHLLEQLSFTAFLSVKLCLSDSLSPTDLPPRYSQSLPSSPLHSLPSHSLTFSHTTIITRGQLRILLVYGI